MFFYGEIKKISTFRLKKRSDLSEAVIHFAYFLFMLCLVFPKDPEFGILALVLLNKLRCHALFTFSANQIA